MTLCRLISLSVSDYATQSLVLVLTHEYANRFAQGPVKALNELDFVKQGEVHRDLIVLLRSMSPHFADLIDKQVIIG